MNIPECSTCGSLTSAIGSVQPTPEELKWGAGRVEGYRCNQCQRQVRFPRYNHPQKLLGMKIELGPVGRSKPPSGGYKEQNPL